MKRQLLPLASLACVLVLSPSLSAQNVLFFDDFDGPLLSPVWQEPLPDFSLDGPIIYVGTPSFSFQKLGGDSVVRLQNSLPDLRQVGWSTATNFLARSFRYEVRFDTLVQSPTTSVDGFIQLWVLDATDPTRFVFASLFGGNYSANRMFNALSSLETSGASSPFPYADSTRYRLVIEGTTNQPIRASLLSDAGVELIGHHYHPDISPTASTGCESHMTHLEMLKSQPVAPEALTQKR